IQGKAERLAGFYKDTGLERLASESFENELQLGMTIGTSHKFREEYIDRLNAERSQIALK
ncbi:hypothetical protein IW143_003545, partial [Coemansia sp. RSA 520]